MRRPLRQLVARSVGLVIAACLTGLLVAVVATGLWGTFGNDQPPRDPATVTTECRREELLPPEAPEFEPSPIPPAQARPCVRLPQAQSS